MDSQQSNNTPALTHHPLPSLFTKGRRESCLTMGLKGHADLGILFSACGKRAVVPWQPGERELWLSSSASDCEDKYLIQGGQH